MQLGTQKIKYLRPITILIILALFLSACGVFQIAGKSSSSQADDVFDEIDLSSDSSDSGGSEGESDSSADDIPVESLVEGICPKKGNDMPGFFLIVHSWDFSPNRDLEMMKVVGQTAEATMCPITVNGSSVSAKTCLVPITNTGFVKTDDGMCDIQASGYAAIDFEDGFCEEGMVTVTITESLDADAGHSGAMNCPDTSQPYIPFYPPSITTASFEIKSDGFTFSESMDPDISNQFKYDKKWNLMFDDLID
jgi:hypothetical protein